MKRAGICCLFFQAVFLMSSPASAYVFLEQEHLSSSESVLLPSEVYFQQNMMSSGFMSSESSLFSEGAEQNLDFRSSGFGDGELGVEVPVGGAYGIFLILVLFYIGIKCWFLIRLKTSDQLKK